MNTVEFLRRTWKIEERYGVSVLIPRPRVVCKDGFNLSVQADRWHYCYPREDLSNGEYKAVEIGFPNNREELLIPYAERPLRPMQTVYSCVPVEVVDKVIEKHGGINIPATFGGDFDGE